MADHRSLSGRSRRPLQPCGRTTGEDAVTCAYLVDTAREAALVGEPLLVSDIGWAGSRFYVQEREIRTGVANHVRKPILVREGANVSIVRNGQEIALTDGA